MIKVESASGFKRYSESLRRKKKESVRKEGDMGGALALVRKRKKNEGEKLVHEPDPEPKTVQAKHRPFTIVANLALYKPLRMLGHTRYVSISMFMPMSPAYIVLQELLIMALMCPNLASALIYWITSKIQVQVQRKSHLLDLQSS